MVILYKHFNPVRTALCVAFLLFFAVFLNVSAYAADPIFTVENIAVDAKAENALAAREKAFEEARVKAFEELAKRMLPEHELATFQTPEPLTISTMIKDFEIVNEKLSAVRYVGTYTFRFKDDVVRRYFEQSGTVFSDVSSKSLLLLPFLKQSNQLALWTPFNVWRQAWNRSSDLGGIVPIELPLGDLEDVQSIGDNEAYEYNPMELQNLLARYNAGEAVIAIAIPDEQLAAIDDDNAIAEGALAVEIYRTDMGRPELVKQIQITANGAQTKAMIYDMGVIKVHQALQQDWKAKTTIRASQTNALQVIIPIKSLQEWLETQAMLKHVYGIEGSNVKSLSPRQAVVDLLYQGDLERLKLTLSQSGLTLSETTDHLGNIKYMLQTGRNAPAVPNTYEQKF